MKLKQALETLDIEFDLDDGAMLTDVVVIAKVARPTGATTLVYASTEGIDLITQFGLVSATQRILAGEWERGEPYSSD